MMTRPPEVRRATEYFLRQAFMQKARFDPTPEPNSKDHTARSGSTHVRLSVYGPKEGRIFISQDNSLGPPTLAIMGYSCGKTEQPKLFFVGLSDNDGSPHGRWRGSIASDLSLPGTVLIYYSGHPLLLKNGFNKILEGDAAETLFRYSAEQLPERNTQALLTVFELNNYNPPQRIKEILQGRLAK